MADRERIIEGTWNCSSCGTEKILARYPKCQVCGNPREGADKESNFDFGKQSATGGLEAQSVTDAKVLERANAGVDWYCGFCKTANAGTREKCLQCGAEKGAKEGEGKVEKIGAQGAAAPGFTPVQERPGVTLVNPGGPAAVKAMEDAARAKKGSTGRVLGIGCASAIALVGALLFFGLRSHEVVGDQISAHWDRTVFRETFTPTVSKGWKDELHEHAPVMPKDGQGEDPGVLNVRDCHEEQRGTRQVADGTRHVCETKSHKVQCGTEEKCSTTNMGNGFAKESCHDVPKYCDEDYQDCRDETVYRQEPVYGDKCSYDTYAWTLVQTEKSSGGVDAPKWPEVQQGALDRLRKEEKYSVEFAYRDGKDEKRFTAEPTTEAEFERVRSKKTAKLKVSMIGGASLAEGDAP